MEPELKMIFPVVDNISNAIKTAIFILPTMKIAATMR